MMIYMKRKLLGFILIAMSIVMSPAAALAQDDAADKVYDARLESFNARVTLENSSTALIWLLLIILAAICVGVMFKNSKRTHLD
jgi:hypothetical protein